MDALTVMQICAEKCRWPCKLHVTSDLIIIVAAVIYLVQWLKGKLSNK
jgi:hypothetical protein